MFPVYSARLVMQMTKDFCPVQDFSCLAKRLSVLSFLAKDQIVLSGRTGDLLVLSTKTNKKQFSVFVVGVLQRT